MLIFRLKHLPKPAILIADLLLLTAMLLWLPFDPQVNKGLAIMTFIAILWLTEALHVVITALLVPILATLLGVFGLEQSLSQFSNPILYLFFGGFALSTALSKQKLDQLLINKIMQFTGGQLKRGVLLLFGVTAFVSMWISNTASTVMMLPLALGMLNSLGDKSDQGGGTQSFILIGIAYSASLGGIGTLVGSPPNAIAAAQMGMGFNDWLMFGLPLMFILLPLGIALLYTTLKPQLNHRIEVETHDIPWTTPRRVTLGIFLATVGLWLFSQPISQLLGGIKQFDSLVALLAVIAIAVTRVASWDELRHNTDWGVLFLFGGGLTLSGVLEATKTSTFLAETISQVLMQASPFFVLLAIATAIVALTELVSNTAAAALLIPLFTGVAEALGLSPVITSVLIAVGASCAFMLPVATPPNAIVFASGFIKQRDLMRSGLRLHLVFVPTLTLLAYFFGGMLV